MSPNGTNGRNDTRRNEAEGFREPDRGERIRPCFYRLHGRCYHSSSLKLGEPVSREECERCTLFKPLPE